MLWKSAMAVVAISSSMVADDQVIEIASVPCRLTSSGTYQLTRDLACGEPNGAAITIDADEVVLDLNGHTLSGTAGPSSAAVGILAIDRQRVRIINGHISGFYFGVDIRTDDTTGSTSTRHRLTGLHLENNWYFGIRLVGSDSKILRCRVSSTGGSTRQGHTIPHGVRLVGSRNLLKDNCIRDLHLCRQADGRGEIVGVHFDAARGSRMEGNTIIELRTEFDDSFPEEDSRERRFAVWINGGPDHDTWLTVKDNVFSGFTVALAFTPGTDGVVEGNTIVNAAPAPIRGKPSAHLGRNIITDKLQNLACPEWKENQPE